MLKDANDDAVICLRLEVIGCYGSGMLNCLTEALFTRGRDRQTDKQRDRETDKQRDREYHIIIL